MNWHDKEVPWTAYGLVVVIGLFVIVKVSYLLPRFSDGNVYLYLSYLIGEGLIPYRDFFYSSLPFIPYLFAVYGLFFGYTWQSFVYLPIILTCVDAVLLYWLIRRYGSALGALVGATLYILSYATLATTDFVTDVHVVITFVLLGVVASEKKWLILSGGLFTLAFLSKLYVLVLIVAFVARFAWQRKWVELVKFSGIFVVLVGVVSLGVWLVAGKEFYELVILSHLGKISGLSKSNMLSYFVRHDWLLVLAPIGWFVTKKKIPSLIVIPMLALAVFYVFWQDIYYLYLKVLVVWLAIWWGWIVASLESKYKNKNKEMVVAVLVLLSISAGFSIKAYLTEQAEAAVIYPLEDIVEYVAANTSEDDFVYGAFEVTPLVALAANRKIWQNMADTNIKFFQTGLFNYEERERQIKQDKVPVIITKALLVKGGRLSRGPEEVLPRRFFNENCRIGQTYSVEKDYSHNAVIVWKCGYKINEKDKTKNVKQQLKITY